MIIKKSHDGIIEYELNGSLHRPNGPACIWSEDIHWWCLYGVQHRYYGQHRKNPTDRRGYSWYIHGRRIK